MAKKKDDGQQVVADNRKARHLYFIESTLEAGLVLGGSEVEEPARGQGEHRGKPMPPRRTARSISMNAYIPEYLDGEPVQSRAAAHTQIADQAIGDAALGFGCAA